MHQGKIWRRARVSLMYFNPIEFGSSISSQTFSWLHLSLTHHISSNSLEVSWGPLKEELVSTPTTPKSFASVLTRMVEVQLSQLPKR